MIIYLCIYLFISINLQCVVQLYIQSKQHVGGSQSTKLLHIVNMFIKQCLCDRFKYFVNKFDPQ